MMWRNTMEQEGEGEEEEEEEGDGLLLKGAEDISEAWVRRFLSHKHKGAKSEVEFRSWRLHTCPSKDYFAGFSSSRASITVDYDVLDVTDGGAEEGGDAGSRNGEENDRDCTSIRENGDAERDADGDVMNNDDGGTGYERNGEEEIQWKSEWRREEEDEGDENDLEEKSTRRKNNRKRRRKRRKEVYVIKMIPTQGLMAGLLTSEGMHHTEAGQYGRFLWAVEAWERARRGVRVGVVGETVPAHALALSTPAHLTIVLPDLTHLGYQVGGVVEGLEEDQVMRVTERFGRFHGTVVAFKLLTGTDLTAAFPGCFSVVSVDSPVFNIFNQAGFERLREAWSGDESRLPMLQKLEHYLAVAPHFIVDNLLPKEPFATAIHGDLQPSNIFFRTGPDGETEMKVIDWATARYCHGALDLIYLLNMGVGTEVRRKVELRAKDAYFDAFNLALRQLQTGISFPREEFERQYLVGRQLVVFWSIMSFNLFFAANSPPALQSRFHAILSDVLLDPSVPTPSLSYTP